MIFTKRGVPNLTEISKDILTSRAANYKNLNNGIRKNTLPYPAFPLISHALLPLSSPLLLSLSYAQKHFFLCPIFLSFILSCVRPSLKQPPLDGDRMAPEYQISHPGRNQISLSQPFEQTGFLGSSLLEPTRIPAHPEPVTQA